jgi:hypothetical protein
MLQMNNKGREVKKKRNEKQRVDEKDEKKN